MSVRCALRKLAELRSNHTNEAGENTIECVDLTDSDFPWRDYLANRSDEMLATIIGTGVVRFELRFANSEEKIKNRTDATSSLSEQTAQQHGSIRVRIVMHIL